MGKMMEIYRQMYGERVIGREGSARLNGPCPFCQDGYDRFIIMRESKEKLGDLCEQYGFKEFYLCNRCRKGGDVISFLTEACKMTFAEACEELGITTPKHEKRERKAPKEAAPAPAFEGRKAEAPKEIWEEHAHRMAKDAQKVLPMRHNALAWLAKRGITLHMAERYGLGFLDADVDAQNCRYRPRSSFGLPPKKNEAGKDVRMLWIPRGITIPSYGPDGRIGMFRVRRPNADLKETVKPNGKVKKDEKYWELTGGTKESFHLPPTVRQNVTVYLITEAELDSVLLHALAGESVGCVALRNATNKPDAAAHAALAKADLILLCLDDDEAGDRGDEWWLKNYRTARVAKVPGAKDAGEAFGKGIDLRAWLEKAVPRSVRLAESTREARTAFERPAPREESPADLTSTAPTEERMRGVEAGMDGFRGAGDSPEPTYACGEELVQDEFADLLGEVQMRGLRAAMPAYWDFEATPREVLALSQLWRGAPIRYHKAADGGFGWDVNATWARKNAEHYERFMRLATSAPSVWEWLCTHVDAEIDSRNFLNLFGAA